MSGNSGPKRWVSSKVHRKSSSKSSLSSYHSSSSPLPLDERTPPSPPIRLPKEDTTAATSIVDFGSGSTFMTQKSDGRPSTFHDSNSSIDSLSTALTQSPSTTPPKKIWEKNYNKFLKRTGKHSKVPPFLSGARGPSGPIPVPIKPSPTVHAHRSHKPSRSWSHKPSKSSENFTTLLPHTHQQQSLISSQNTEDWGPSLADGFDDHSPRNHSTNDSKLSLTAPSSPSKHKESSIRGGGIFKRMRSKTRSSDNLDMSMRKGDRKSPANTPPGSAASTPINKRSPLTPTLGVTTLQEGMEKAVMLSEFLAPPTLTSSCVLGSHHKLGPKPVPRSISSQGVPNDDNLDRARHRGHHSVSMAPSVMMPQPPTTLSMTPALFTRVQSMGSNLIIPEGEPVINHSNREEQLVRERKKAFTDFHNMGIDSSSAYLGDESSLHRHSAFLSSMAYPAGSAGAGGKSECNISFLNGHSSCA